MELHGIKQNWWANDRFEIWNHSLNMHLHTLLDSGIKITLNHGESYKTALPSYMVELGLLLIPIIFSYKMSFVPLCRRVEIAALSLPFMLGPIWKTLLFHSRFTFRQMQCVLFCILSIAHLFLFLSFFPSWVIFK